MEERSLLAGNVVAFFVNGLGGEAIPTEVYNHLVDLANSNTIPQVTFDIFETNWNSPSPKTESGFPGGATFLPTFPYIVIAPGVPLFDNDFVDNLAELLEDDYDDADVIILVGHSFGADSVLQVAQGLAGKRQIDLLATLDRVGTGGTRLTPLRGGVPDNVNYFYNRWQENGPFPFDFSFGGDRRFAVNDGRIASDFGIADQKAQNTAKNADDSTREHGCGIWDVLGHCQVVLEVPSLPDLPFFRSFSTALLHADYPHDDRIQFELNTIIDGLVPQRPKAVAGPDIVTIEGATVVLNGSGADPNPSESLTFEWTRRGNPGVVLSNSASFSFVPGDNGHFEFVFTVTDSFGLSDSDHVAVTVENVPPAVEPILAADTVIRGFPTLFVVEFSDPGLLDTHVLAWIFGDGSTRPFQPVTSESGSASRKVEHVYTTSGTYSVTAIVRDDDFGVGLSTRQVTVKAAGLVPNPTNPLLMDLLVGGTPGSDTISVGPGSSAGSVRVVIEGELDEEFDPTGDIKVAGWEGADVITIAGGLHRPVFVFGGDGNDILNINGATPDGPVTAFGEDGDDVFHVSAVALNLDSIMGRTVVIGGDGVDELVIHDEANAIGSIYLITPTFVQRNPRVDYQSVEHLRVNAGIGSDIFDVQPSVSTRYYIGGNMPEPGRICGDNGDFLKLDTGATGTTGRHLEIFERGRGRWTFTSDHEPVEFESIERFNHVDVVAVGPDDGFDSHPLVKVYDAETREFKFEFYAYGLDHRNGVRVATGDLDEDGLPDIVTAAGRLHAPEIRVFNGTPQAGLTASELAALQIRADQTFGASFINGMQLAVGDVTGDGCRDIVAVPTRGRATVKVFENRLGGSLTETRSFDAFPDLTQFIGGATVAIADTDGASDGNTRGDIIVASGPGMPGRIRVFDVSAPASAYAAIREISDPNAGFNGGLNVAVGDVNGDQIADILTGAGPGGISVVHVYDGRMGSPNQPLNSFRAFVDESSNSSVRVAARDVDDDGNAEIFVVQGSDGRNGYQIKVFDALNASPVNPDPSTPGTVTSSSALVRQLYLDVLGREPEPGAWQYWAGQLDFGQATPDQIATGILESDERMDPVIRQMYRDYLFREAEPGGLAYWRGIWREHGSPDEVTAGIVSSLEFYQSAGATNQLWVAELYRRLLGRDADGNGLAYWSQSLDSGQFERDEVVGGFTDSAENARNLVRSWFTQYLDRAAAEGEVDTYAHLLLNGRSQRAVQLDLVTSQEYGRLAVQSIAGQSDLVDAFFANAQDFTGGGLFLG